MVVGWWHEVKKQGGGFNYYVKAGGYGSGCGCMEVVVLLGKLWTFFLKSFGWYDMLNRQHTPQVHI